MGLIQIMGCLPVLAAVMGHISGFPWQIINSHQPDENLWISYFSNIANQHKYNVFTFKKMY